jgi:hypothetical protein
MYLLPIPHLGVRDVYFNSPSLKGVKKLPPPSFPIYLLIVFLFLTHRGEEKIKEKK